jgi:predicted GIY-YIG superfamily endonuclease
MQFVKFERREISASKTMNMKAEQAVKRVPRRQESNVIKTS